MHDSLYAISKSLLNTSSQTSDILRIALSLTCEQMHVPQGCIVTFADAGTLQDAYIFGSEQNNDRWNEFWNYQINQGVIRTVYSERRAVLIDNITEARNETTVEFEIFASGSMLSLPLVHEKTGYGVFTVIHPQPNFFSDAKFDFLQEVVDLVTMSLRNARALESVQMRESVYRRMIDKANTERMEQAKINQLQHDLTAMTHHDLRNFLGNIQTSLSGLERLIKAEKYEAAIEFTLLAQRSALQMSNMVKSLLDIERLEQGRTILNYRNTDIGVMLRETAEIILPLTLEAGQKFDVQILDSLPVMRIDSDMISRVIINLVENAVKHTPTGGQITLVGQFDLHNNVIISIRDTGQGVPEHLKAVIFDKFFRIKHEDAPTGVGLGLAFCRLAIDSHGGNIWVDSVQGEGSTFSFTLPIIADLANNGHRTNMEEIDA